MLRYWRRLVIPPTTCGRSLPVSMPPGISSARYLLRVHTVRRLLRVRAVRRLLWVHGVCLLRVAVRRLCQGRADGQAGLQTC